jgi:hypothetical protein
MTQLLAATNVLPVYRGNSDSPVSFVLVDQDIHTILQPFRWLLRPRTSEGYHARTFINSRPISLQQMILLLDTDPTTVERLKQPPDELLPWLIRRQNALPKIYFRNNNGLDCRRGNLQHITRSMPGLPFPPDDPVNLGPDVFSDVIPPQDIPHPDNPTIQPPPKIDETNQQVLNFLFNTDKI